MRVQAAVLAAMLVAAPLAARAADLTVWWESGWNPQEDQAVRETVAAFEKKTGDEVDLVFETLAKLPARATAAVEAGQPPDVVYGIEVALIDFPRWAHDSRLADLTDAMGPLAAQHPAETGKAETQGRLQRERRRLALLHRSRQFLLSDEFSAVKAHRRH